MKWQLFSLGAIAALLVACEKQEEDPAPRASVVVAEEDVAVEDSAEGELEAKPTPGERLDTAIEATGRGLKTAGEKTEEGVKVAAEKTEAALQTAGEKTEEGVRKAAEATGGFLRKVGEKLEEAAGGDEAEDSEQQP